MNIEFHYYTIHALCLEAGYPFEQAETMARSSQFVDDAVVPYRFDTPNGPYQTLVTQNYLFWDETIQRDIYLPFHFLPGLSDKAGTLRKDGRSNPYAVTPNGPIAKELLVGAFRTGNPYRVGIALHSFADTWAHQNFSGRAEPWNELSREDGSRGLSFRDAVASLPSAGHLHALSDPDTVGNRWEDPRLVPEAALIDNNERFRAAALKIFRYLRTALGKPFEDEELILDELSRIWREPDAGARIADYAIAWGVPKYEAAQWPLEAGVPREFVEGKFGLDGRKFSWLREELSRFGRQFSASAGPGTVKTGVDFNRSCLYEWNEAALMHLAYAKSALEREGP